jgi:D-glycero-alpha-D-manno-heptose-7-phosphate kinase
MIISRTPLRMSFVGGGSDLPSYYREHGGAVVSTAIDKYVYVTMNRKFDSGIRVAYSRVEEVNSVSEIEHQLVRAALNMAGVPGGVEITTVADIPSRGTGLGSSSSFTVALLHALYALLGRHSTRQELAEQACHVEIDVCGEPIGKQDQYAAAYGGFNLYEFNPNDTVTVSPVICKPETIAGIRKQMLVLYTGITRGASTILKHQSAELATNVDKKSAMKRMVSLCYQLLDEIRNDNLDSFGQILHEAWMLKRDMAPGVSTSDIDDWYDTARKHGAIGGKILGAGAGGFLALFAPEDRHEAIRHALPKLRAISVDFERMGSQIIFYQPTSNNHPVNGPGVSAKL